MVLLAVLIFIPKVQAESSLPVLFRMNTNSVNTISLWIVRQLKVDAIWIALTKTIIMPYRLQRAKTMIKVILSQVKNTSKMGFIIMKVQIWKWEWSSIVPRSRLKSRWICWLVARSSYILKLKFRCKMNSCWLVKKKKMRKDLYSTKRVQR